MRDVGLPYTHPPSVCLCALEVVHQADGRRRDGARRNPAGTFAGPYYIRWYFCGPFRTDGFQQHLSDRAAIVRDSQRSGSTFVCIVFLYFVQCKQTQSPSPLRPCQGMWCPRTRPGRGGRTGSAGNPSTASSHNFEARSFKAKG